MPEVQNGRRSTLHFQDPENECLKFCPLGGTLASPSSSSEGSSEVEG